MNSFISDKLSNILWRLFGKRLLNNMERYYQSVDDGVKYSDIKKENITALLAGSVANIATGDSQIQLTAKGGGNTRFTDTLQSIALKEWSRINKTVAHSLGFGLVVSLPYSVDNGLGRKIYVDTVSKDRFFITGVQGDEITQCAVLADEIVRNNKRYKRFTDYNVENGVYIIRNRATCNDAAISLKDVEEWENIAEEIRIGGVDRLPVAILRCPQNPRCPDSVDGVPITFGCDATLEKIAKTLNDIEREFDKKKSKIFADRSLIKLHKNDSGDTDNMKTRKEFENNDLYVAFNNSDRLGVDIFDPAFRDTSYYNELEKHFAFLEKECGLSEGVLTKLSSSNATATEIRRAMYNTFCFCDSIQSNVQAWFNDLMYACSVLMNYYGIAPYSEYEVKFSWSYALLEDSMQTFSQLMQAESIGAEDLADIRLFNHPEETREEAEAAIEKIKANRKTVQQLVEDDAE